MKNPNVNNLLYNYKQEFYHKVFVTHWGRSELKYNASDIYVSDQPNYFVLHEIEQNMILMRKLGYAKPTPKQYVNFEQLPKSQKTIGVHSGCFGGVWEKKKYPYFLELIKQLLELKFQVFNFGGMNERINIEHQDFQDFAGYQDLQDSINLMSRCNYFIANDSGLMHIADALNIPLIALFGSTLIVKNRPVNPNSHVLTGNLKCQPCQYSERFNTCQDWQCMKLITVDHILNFIIELKWC